MIETVNYGNARHYKIRQAFEKTCRL